MDNFGINQGLVEELYARYRANPQGVDPSWRRYFEQLTRGQHQNGGAAFAAATNGAVANGQATAGVVDHPSSVTGRVYQLITAFRFLGHLSANINPLGRDEERVAELDYRRYGFTDSDLDRSYPCPDIKGPPERTLREIVSLMEDTYCGSIGVEYRNIENTEERHWLGERMEASRNCPDLTREQQMRLLKKLSDAENLEKFLQASYAPGTKRFSLEGAESLIPLLDSIIERGASHGMTEMVFGMAHRGRLNVLVNTLNVSLREVFYTFEDNDAQRYLGRGDVKYHLGFSSDITTTENKKVHLTMTFNPSHLEFVNPVVLGRARAKQRRAKDVEGKQIIPLLIHGDAAFVGQGVVAESLNLAGLAGYTTGGTIHVIVNNQIGFTTDPCDSRTTRYASDIMKSVNVPVFHVNGEDAQAVAQVASLAVEYRQRFHKDVLIDLYSYRLHGHNEGDEPRFTQPKMYELIDAKPSVLKMYVNRLVELGHVTEQKAHEISERRRQKLADAFNEVREHGYNPEPDAMGGVWKSYLGGADAEAPECDTSVDRDTLIELSEQINTLPSTFNAHRKVTALLKQRHKRIVQGTEFDWGTAELLAYATILSEGTPIRLSGEDVGRGTFSHRHGVLVDQKTGEHFSPLDHVQKGTRYDSFNSPLSEAGVLGFEFGYSLDSPDSLVIWEAQFGDFLNAAQVIVDQFITSCEDKWNRLTGLTLYLPHGYEGQGPEHSSARLERFLQNCAEDNIQVCNLTTPAQLFHCMRRQVNRRWRKPLVIMTPKSLLRAAYSVPGPKPTSTVDDLASGRFQRVIGDDTVNPKKVKRILLCSGKVYYDLAQHRFREKCDDVAIVRLEQLYPLNAELDQALAAFADGTPLYWVQEEPENFGAWFYINASLPESVRKRFPLKCLARKRSASPATGSKSAHKIEQKIIVDSAFADAVADAFADAFADATAEVIADAVAD